MGYRLEISPEAKDFIAGKGYDQQYGARPLKRSLQKYLEDPLAELIINSELAAGDLIKVDFKILTSIVKQEPEAPQIPETTPEA